jgi:hypothetical protein
MLRTLGTIGLVLMLLAAGLPSAAQADAQFCVRAFEDRNANGIRDGGEPLLQSSISAELANEDGIIVGSALLENSPTAAQGVICFQGLAPGQYTIFVGSAEYAPTTPDTMTAALRSGELPAVLEFGAGPLAAGEPQLEIIEVRPETALERVLIALLGAIGAALVMMILGLLVFLLFVRPRLRTVPVDVTPPDDLYRRPAPPKTDTGTYFPPRDKS